MNMLMAWMVLLRNGGQRTYWILGDLNTVRGEGAYIRFHSRSGWSPVSGLSHRTWPPLHCSRWTTC